MFVFSIQKLFLIYIYINNFESILAKRSESSMTSLDRNSKSGSSSSKSSISRSESSISSSKSSISRSESSISKSESSIRKSESSISKSESSISSSSSSSKTRASSDSKSKDARIKSRAQGSWSSSATGEDRYGKLTEETEEDLGLDYVKQRQIKAVLYLNEYSPASRATHFCIEVLKLKPRIEKLNVFKREHLSNRFQKVNHLQTLPVLEMHDKENRLVLKDSTAIMIYLLRKYGKKSPLYPKEPEKQAKIFEKLFYAATYLRPLFSKIFYTVSYERSKPIKQEWLDELYYRLKEIDDMLQPHKWIAGKELSIADFTFGTYLNSLQVLRAYLPNFDNYSNIDSYVDFCRSNIMELPLDLAVRLPHRMEKNEIPLSSEYLIDL